MTEEKACNRLPRTAVNSFIELLKVRVPKAIRSWIGNFYGAPVPTDFTAWLIGRLMGLVFLVAFLSQGTQIMMLAGSSGLHPVARILPWIESNYGQIAWWRLPTLCWFNASDFSLILQATLGGLAAFLLLLGLIPVPAALICWTLYLSLSVAGGPFFAFQWDALLLEAGMLTILLSPWCGLARTRHRSSRWVLWLFRFLFAKLMFLSGWVKLTAVTPHWRDGTALHYHFWTQPLPNPLAPWVAQLPSELLEFACHLVVWGELVIAVLVILPRPFRLAACATGLALQAGITLTGNYGFFNLLTAVLCLSLLDDGIFRQARSHPSLPHHWPKWLLMMVVSLIASLSLAKVLQAIFPSLRQSSVWTELIAFPDPLRSINTYGLFAHMTTERPELLIETSRNMDDWEAVIFRYKPVALNYPLPITGWHMPRLDWQLWFAALSAARQPPEVFFSQPAHQWFAHLIHRLLIADARLHRYLRRPPSNGMAPRFIRVRLAYYRFATDKNRRDLGHIWDRTTPQVYGPVWALDPSGRLIPLQD